MAKNINKLNPMEGVLPPKTNTQSDTQSDAPNYGHAPIRRERNTARVQLVMKPSMVEALDAYAEYHDTSRSEIIKNLVEEFLKNNQ